MRGLSRKVEAIALPERIMKKRRTIIYIDGYNLYYGLLKGSTSKWLDLLALARNLLNDTHEIIEVRYYTSIVKPSPYDAAAVERQNVYLQALGTMCLVKVVLGFYSKHTALMAPQRKRCSSCEESKDGYVRVMKLEEKRSDVNLAIDAVADAALDRADSFVLITGDSDQTGTIDKIRRQFNKPVIVFDPHEKESQHLKKAATFYKNIPRDLPAKCQLPDAIPVGTLGNFICRPAAWK